MLRRAALVSCLLVGCAASESPRPAPAAERVDKRSLYGDPTLVPTRRGERARREIALASEIEAILEVRADVDDAHCDVELDDARPRVVVAVRVVPGTEPETIQAQADAVVRTIVGEDTSVVATVSPGLERGEGRSERRSLDVPLALALLGFGVSMGVTAERLLRARRRRPPTRSTTKH